MTVSEFYTTQFYAWEYRGRRWYIANEPIQLEAPFIPFFRHGYSQEYVDDGKRHTLVSKLIEGFSKKQIPTSVSTDRLDYESLEPFQAFNNGTFETLQVKLPKERNQSPEKMKACLLLLASIDMPISFEILGTATSIVIQFVCDSRHSSTVQTYLQAFFPHYSVIRSESTDFILRDDQPTAVVDFGLRHEFVRPLQTSKSFSADPLIGVFAILERLSHDEQAGVQVLFQPAVNQWDESIIRSVTMHDGSSFFLDAAESPELAKQKVQSPLYAVTIRTFSQAQTIERALSTLDQISFSLIQGTKGTGNEFLPLTNEDYDFESRVHDIFFRQSHRLGMLLNLDELVSIIHFPSDTIVSSKMSYSARKTKAVPQIAIDKEFTIGENFHDGIRLPVTFSSDDRLKHVHIIGATGTGKSTLVANLILQDIGKGTGVILFDPHGDLINDVISHIPVARLHDVVLVDPSDNEFPIGLNILEAHTEIEKEVLSSDLVAIFKKYATSWGDQMSAILGNAILAILENPEGGSLHELRRFLIERQYRESVLQKVTDPSILYYWQKEFPLSKSNSIGPILTRLDTFLRPRSLRNMVVQKEGLDFEALCNANKIVLLKLSQGLIGIENSYLLGSLILSKIHLALLKRQSNQLRAQTFIYLDEFQNFITPSIKEMISGVRKYNAGLILVHQDLQQLHNDPALLNTVLGNVNTRIVFRVGEPDARRLQDGFSGFDESDLQNLGRGEAVIRIEQPQYDCSLQTMPLAHVSPEQADANLWEVIAQTRENYSGSKQRIERELLASFNSEIVKHKPAAERLSKQERIQPKQFTQEYESSFKPTATIKPDENVVSNEMPDTTTHRYLQLLIKKMAEARGYVATLEVRLPEGSGQVDVLLTKDGKLIAIEVCSTTEPEWEMHNIMKCIQAKYHTVISLSGDPRQLSKIRERCEKDIQNFSSYDVHFFTPDALFAFLDEQIVATIPAESTMKGYRVNVTYEAISKEDMDRKRANVAKVVMDSLRKKKNK